MVTVKPGSVFRRLFPDLPSPPHSGFHSLQPFSVPQNVALGPEGLRLNQMVGVESQREHRRNLGLAVPFVDTCNESQVRSKGPGYILLGADRVEILCITCCW